MPTGSLENGKGSVNIGAKIDARQLNRRHDIGATGKMKNAIGAAAPGFHGRRIGDIGTNHLELPGTAVLLQIGLTADGKIIDHPHPPTGSNQPVDEMTADKTGSARDNI